MNVLVLYTGGTIGMYGTEDGSYFVLRTRIASLLHGYVMKYL